MRVFYTNRCNAESGSNRPRAGPDWNAHDGTHGRAGERPEGLRANPEWPQASRTTSFRLNSLDQRKSHDCWKLRRRLRATVDHPRERRARPGVAGRTWSTASRDFVGPLGRGRLFPSGTSPARISYDPPLRHRWTPLASAGRGVPPTGRSDGGERKVHRACDFNPSFILRVDGHVLARSSRGRV